MERRTKAKITLIFGKIAKKDIIIKGENIVECEPMNWEKFGKRRRDDKN